MKTMKNGAEIIRVSEDKVNLMLKSGYDFVSKSEFKKDKPEKKVKEKKK